MEASDLAHMELIATKVKPHEWTVGNTYPNMWPVIIEVCRNLPELVRLAKIGYDQEYIAVKEASDG